VALSSRVPGVLVPHTPGIQSTENEHATGRVEFRKIKHPNSQLPTKQTTTITNNNNNNLAEPTQANYLTMTFINTAAKLNTLMTTFINPATNLNSINSATTNTDSKDTTKCQATMTKKLKPSACQDATPRGKEDNDYNVDDDLELIASLGDFVFY
jgi:hypothetical protein